MADDTRLLRFEQAILPHLDAAYNLARWLTRDGHQAEDLVQESYLRAFKSFDRFRGGDGRGWLLAIVRNTCYTWLTQRRARERVTSFDEEVHGSASDEDSPDRACERKADAELLHGALDELAPEHREVLVLRELEGLSYKDIAAVIAVPLGTVMSRLTRARARLQERLAPRRNEEP